MGTGQGLEEKVQPWPLRVTRLRGGPVAAEPRLCLGMVPAADCGLDALQADEGSAVRVPGVWGRGGRQR